MKINEWKFLKSANMQRIAEIGNGTRDIREQAEK